MKMKIIYLTLVIFLPVIYLQSCGGGAKVRKAESVVDTPRIHYERGKDLFIKGNLKEANYEFKMANSLDPRYAPAFEGMAWIYLEKGQLLEAKKAADKALDLDGKWVLARLVRARVKAKEGKYKDAIKEAEKAIKNVPDSTVPDKKQALIEAYLTLGDIYRDAEEYNNAQTAYTKVLEIDNTNMRADRAIKELAAYKTAVSGQAPELKKIAGQKEITRADVAVLFVLELPLSKIFRNAPSATQAKFRPPGAPTMGKRGSKVESAGGLPPDVPENYWARSFIEEVLARGVMETFPDGTFRPDEKVNRAEFARLIEKFLVRYWNDPGLQTRYFGSASPFSDVNNTSPIFNSIIVVSSRNIIPGFEDGTFRPLMPVSGAEALNIIRTLKSQL